MTSGIYPRNAMLIHVTIQYLFMIETLNKVRKETFSAL